MLDAVHHLLCFALDLLTGNIEDVVDAEYIYSLEWYYILPEILAGDADEDDKVQASGEMKDMHSKVCTIIRHLIHSCNVPLDLDVPW